MSHSSSNSVQLFILDRQPALTTVIDLTMQACQGPQKLPWYSLTATYLWANAVPSSNDKPCCRHPVAQIGTRDESPGVDRVF